MSSVYIYFRSYIQTNGMPMGRNDIGDLTSAVLEYKFSSNTLDNAYLPRYTIIFIVREAEKKAKGCYRLVAVSSGTFQSSAHIAQLWTLKSGN